MTPPRRILLGAGLAAVAAVALVLVLRPSGPRGEALDARQRAMKLLGETLAGMRPGSPVLVLSNPFARDSGRRDDTGRFERAGTRGLREGLGSRSELKVVFPEIRPEYHTDPASVIIPPDSRTPLSFLVEPASVDRLAEEHPECRVIVSLIGLPIGVEGLKVWEEGDPRGFGLLLPDLRVLGSPARAAAAFRSGKILAAVVVDARTGEPLIVTQDNLAEVLEGQPKSLGY
ncbi:MAG: hypothetical protein KF833_01105 [Verrucomicrobiae bacterium]|nr:hypothetical protein [Verrucomicrobiae bacterium]